MVLLDDSDTDAVQQRLLTDYDVSERTGFSVIKVRRLMGEGELPGKKYGGAWRVTQGEWDRFNAGLWTKEAA